MAFNPARTQEHITSPIERASSLNDPNFVNSEGYYPYDLSHSTFITPRFGEVTPTMDLHTVSGDRFVVSDKTKTILNRINGNLLNELQQYIDSFYVPMRCLFPINYEKLIPNPTKGDDLPNSALPQFPISRFVYDYLNSEKQVSLSYQGTTNTIAYNTIYNFTSSTSDIPLNVVGFARLLGLAFILSRGQLLDYFNLQFDGFEVTKNSILQGHIDTLFNELYKLLDPDGETPLKYVTVNPGLTINQFTVPIFNGEVYDVEKLRDVIFSSYEAGKYLYFDITSAPQSLLTAAATLRAYLNQIFSGNYGSSDATAFITNLDASATPFQDELFINLSVPLAYQQTICQYYTRDSIDNIYNADLYMQLLRSIMFPSTSGFSSEPTFDYNGVATEYDLISTGATFYSLLYSSSSRPGRYNRMWAFMMNLFVMRRSLRYGDYFSTARPRQLAVSDQLSISTDNGVSPIDVTKSLLTQRYLNAVNYVGSSFIPYMQSIMGVTPTTDNCEPKFLAHRTISLVNDVTTNTGEEQGKQTTNIVGYSDDMAFDVFIDDFGVILSLCSFDVLPVYTSGIDSTFHFADRFDYFNSMLQNIGDQQIRTSELVGFPQFRNISFGWTMRNAEYKFKLNKAHGAFCNNQLNGFLLKYPLYDYSLDENIDETKINPDFIRDKPVYLDRVVPVITGVSPADYYHFVISCHNKVKAARKIQLTPPVLF